MIARLLLVCILLAPCADAAYAPSWQAIGIEPLRTVEWIDAHGTSHAGVVGTGQTIVNMEEYNADPHPAMANCYGRSVVFGPVQTDSRAQPVDAVGHGTLVAGAMCAQWDEAGERYDGASPGVRLITTIPIYPHGGNSAEYQQMQRTLHAEHSPRVVTASYSQESDPSVVPATYWAPFADGGDMVHTWSAGNDGGDGTTATTFYTGDDPRIVTVAALDPLGHHRAEYSSVGEVGRPETYPTLSAPGCFFMPMDPAAPASAVVAANNFAVRNLVGSPDCQGITEEDLVEAQRWGYVLHAGTSFATPLVASTFALMFEVNPELTAEDAVHIATRTADRFLPADDLDGDGNISAQEFYDQHGWQVGWGRINATSAVAAAHYLALSPESTVDDAMRCSRLANGMLNPAPGPCAPSVPQAEPVETAMAPNSTAAPEPTDGKRTPFPAGLALFVVAVAARKARSFK